MEELQVELLYLVEYNAKVFFEFFIHLHIVKIRETRKEFRNLTKIDDIYLKHWHFVFCLCLSEKSSN